MKRGNIMERSQWGSKLGFVLAAAGSAIGLGALWRFPYMTAEHGGGAFLLVFLILTLFVGMPLLLSEFVIGRASQRNPIEGLNISATKKHTGCSAGWGTLLFSCCCHSTVSSVDGYSSI